MKQYLITLFLLCSFVAISQENISSHVNLSVRVFDAKTKQTLPFATLKIENKSHTYQGSCNDEGYYSFKNILSGDYTLTVSYIGYQKHIQPIHSRKPTSVNIYLKELSKELSEVIVTASESKGMTSASKIGQDAMKHLQPSSFADLLELLPGGASLDPQLTTPNSIRIREATIPPASQYSTMPRISRSKHATSSLGITFLVDNIPMNTDANMQSLYGVLNFKYKARDFLDKGVDMRTIATDDIENVEIVRGIPSVEYADLTSGLIKINRKRNLTTLDARFKADMHSSLFYIGKGTDTLWKDFNLSSGLSFLSAKADPRNIRETYKRLTISIRGTKRWNWHDGKLRWNSNVDYTGSFDNEKVDPDLNYGNIDSYKSAYNRFSFSHSIEYERKKKSLFSGFQMDVSASISNEGTEVVKFMQLSSGRPYTDAVTEGEHDGLYYPYSYTGEHRVEGKPVYAHLKIKGLSDFNFAKTINHAIWGITWNYSKNKGKGTIFDVNKPIFIGTSTRPRPFYDIPAKKNLACFFENTANVHISSHVLSVMTGAVASSLIGLDKSYAMNRKFYVDPRVNIKFSFARWNIKREPLRVQLTAGIGSHSKFPTMIQLFPDKVYADFVQLNYYHINPNYRRVNIRTYIFQPDNTHIVPARNLKYEFRVDMQYNKYDASITYFKENMENGFRPTSQLIIYNYKYYETQQLDHANMTDKPDIHTLPYTIEKHQGFIGNTTNGSQTKKEGFEWMISTPRYSSLHTRLTFSGAWFKTTYRNSASLYYKPSIILNQKELPYVGIYKDEDGLIIGTLNSDVRADTYLPDLGMNVSLSFQCNWFASSQKLPKSLYPESYVDMDQVTHPYTEVSKTDKYLQWLKRNYTDDQFEKYTVPFLMNVNLKATKLIFDEKVRVALFVNRIFDYSPDFVRKGFTIRRNQTPYFGMELNFRI